MTASGHVLDRSAVFGSVEVQGAPSIRTERADAARQRHRRLRLG